MKRLFIILVVVAGLRIDGFADNSRRQQYAADIGPGTTSYVTINGISLSTGTASQRTCLEFATFFSTSPYTLYILDGLTTSYQLTLGASVVHQAPFSEPFCGSKGGQMILRSSTTVAGATYQINYKGFLGQ